MKFLIIFITSALLLSSCSVLKFSYNNADWLIMNEIDDALDLNDTQKVIASTQLDALLNWHRNTRLKIYEEILATTQSKIQEGSFTTSEVLWLHNISLIEYTTLTTKAMELATPVVSSLEVKQLDVLQEFFQEKNEELKEHIEDTKINSKNYYKERSEKWLERMGDWLGEVTETQENLMHVVLKKLPDLRQQRLEYRQTQQQKIIILMSNMMGKHSSALNSSIQIQKQQLLTRKSSRSGDYLDVLSTNKQVISVFIYDVVQTLTPKQKTHLLEKINDYYQDIITLQTVN